MAGVDIFHSKAEIEIRRFAVIESQVLHWSTGLKVLKKDDSLSVPSSTHALVVGSPSCE